MAHEAEKRANAYWKGHGRGRVVVRPRGFAPGISAESGLGPFDPQRVRPPQIAHHFLAEWADIFRGDCW
jgi:hypothetical protein